MGGIWQGSAGYFLPVSFLCRFGRCRLKRIGAQKLFLRSRTQPRGACGYKQSSTVDVGRGVAHEPRRIETWVGCIALWASAVAVCHYQPRYCEALRPVLDGERRFIPNEQVKEMKFGSDVEVVKPGDKK